MNTIKIFYFVQLSVKNCFIRGSVVRYVQLPADEVDTQLLQDAARKEAAAQTRWLCKILHFILLMYCALIWETTLNVFFTCWSSEATSTQICFIF